MSDFGHSLGLCRLASLDHAAQRKERFPGTGIGTHLPPVSSNLIAGLIEAVAAAPYDGKADLPELTADCSWKWMSCSVKRNAPDAEAGRTGRRRHQANPYGQLFAEKDLNGRKEIFSRALVSYVSLAAHIRRILDERGSHTAPKSRFLDELEDYMTSDAAEETRGGDRWGSVRRVVAYDDETEKLAWTTRARDGGRRRAMRLVLSTAMNFGEPPLAPTLYESERSSVPVSAPTTPRPIRCPLRVPPLERASHTGRRQFKLLPQLLFERSV